MPALTTLINFNGTDGATPHSDLLADAAGNLFGTTTAGGTSDDGTVFEIAKVDGTYAGTPTTLVSFNGINGRFPQGSLIADAAGNLLGTTVGGGTSRDGTVFEIAKVDGTYASAPTTLVSFSGINGVVPAAVLIADASGHLFGTTAEGGTSGDGTVFEIAKVDSGYASTPTTLVTFNGANGTGPFGGLITDATGNLFGTTSGGGTSDSGTVFAIAKVDGTYAGTPTTLVSFNGANGSDPLCSLITDAAGNLFSTAAEGGVNGLSLGTVFEIAKIDGSYASTPTILVNFNGANGSDPLGGLITDAAGYLFGTTAGGG